MQAKSTLVAMKLLKLLVICEDYPSENNPYPMAYVHTRLQQYENLGITVDVLSFRAKDSYVYQNIRVYPESKIDIHAGYSAIISHAPNLKNHVRYIFFNNLLNVIFFIHGHEAIKTNKYYPKPYFFNMASFINTLLRLIYDPIKLFILKHFLSSRHCGSIIYVSEWMKYATLYSLRKPLNKKSAVIYNPININFLNNTYDYTKSKKYDFITIRPLDGEKYCLDIVLKLAESYPGFTFRVIGKGNFFNTVPIPKNLIWLDTFLKPSELILELNESRCALMPTRLDAQGVMMCEIASFGMPIISSNLAIVNEVLDGYSGFRVIDNNDPLPSFQKIVNNLAGLVNVMHNPGILKSRFHHFNTLSQEIDFINQTIL